MCASLQTGSAQVTQRVDPGLVDPRLLTADFSRIGTGLAQGLDLANNFFTARENAQMRPIRKGLAELQLAAAQEYAAQSGDRKALAALRLAGEKLNQERNAVELADAQRRGALAEIAPVVVDTAGVYTQGGDFISPTGKYSDLETGVLEKVFDPKTKTVSERKRSTSVVPGKEVEARVALRESKLAGEAAKIELANQKLELEREKLQALVDKAQAAGNKNLQVMELPTEDGGLAIGVYDKDKGAFSSPPKVIPGVIAAKYDPLRGVWAKIDGVKGAKPVLPSLDIPTVTPAPAAPTKEQVSAARVSAIVGTTPSGQEEKQVDVTEDVDAIRNRLNARLKEIEAAAANSMTRRRVVGPGYVSAPVY